MEKSKKQKLNETVFVEAEFSDSSSNKTFIKSLASQTNNYKRAVENNSLEKNNSYSGYDRLIASKEAFLSKNSLIDSKINLNNNTELIKELKLKLDDTSMDDDKLMQTMRKSKDLNSNIRKAISELYELERLEKKKQLDILKKQEIIQLQKMELQDLNYLDREASLSTSNSDDFKFPNIIRKFDPDRNLNSSPRAAAEKRHKKIKNHDQFYLQRKSLMSYRNNMSFNDIMRIIDEVERFETRKEGYSNGNYYFNGYLIKKYYDFNNTEKSIKHTSSNSSKIILSLF